MADFNVVLSSEFVSEWKEALDWLYNHNLEQSEEFADKKSHSYSL